MSQAQPPQYPPPSSPPPPGYPPGSYPPPPGGGYPPGGVYPQAAPPMQPAPRTSVAAVFSLVLGILGCIPFVTSILAVILGIVGISATKNNRRSGRGLAIAGLLLGLLGIVLWGFFGSAGYGLYRQMTITRPVRNQFINNLASGNISAAQADCTSAITTAELQSWANDFKPLGAIRDITGGSWHAERNNSSNTTETIGVVTFANGQQRSFDLTMDDVNGQWKISKATFEAPGKVPVQVHTTTRP